MEKPNLRESSKQNSNNSPTDELAATQGLTDETTMPIPDEEEIPRNTKPWGRLVSEVPKYGHIDLIGNDLSIGRSKKNSVMITDNLRISGNHCKITRERDGVYIVDMSLNGTFINDEKLAKHQPRQLFKGDCIALAAKRGTEDCVVSYIFYEAKEEDLLEGEITKFYTSKKVLGTGSFSVVKLGINRKSGELRAIKIINKKKYWNSASLDQFEREIDILKKVQHKNIISIIEMYSTPQYLYIVLEYAAGGELFEKILEQGAYSEKEARDVFTQMLNAVAYLHSKGIVHRDLKPENILLDVKGSEVTVKITDFGLARIVGEQEMMTTLCGTPQYVAPEIIMSSRMPSSQEEKKPKQGYGKEVDAWSLGAILYVLLSGTPPFDESRGHLFKQITGGHFEFPHEFWCEVSDPAKDLVRKMMTVNPEKRFTVEQALQHPWIKGNSTKELPSVKVNLRNSQSKRTGMSPIKIPAPHDDSDTEEEMSPTVTDVKKRKGEESSSQSKKLPKKLSFSSNVQ